LKSPTLINETGEGVSEHSTQLLKQNVRDSGKKPCTSSKRTSVSLGKPSASSGKKVTVKDLSKKGSLLFVVLFALNFSIFYLLVCFVIFQNLKIFFDRNQHPNSQITIGIMRRKLLFWEESLANA
jgi:hypothetical protein